MTRSRTDHPDDAVLHDLVDGRLAGADRAAAEAHLAGCASCAARVARLRRLLAAAAALPGELPPAADGWPALRARLAAAPPARGVRGTPARRLRPALLAAALLLGAVGAWRAWEAGRGVADAAPAGAAAAFAAAERDYARAADELAAELRASRARLPAAAAASLDRSLATIDSALVEARSALAADPGNPELARFVAASYEHKLDLLRRSAAITSGD